jgi:hypothetical protein
VGGTGGWKHTKAGREEGGTTIRVFQVICWLFADLITLWRKRRREAARGWWRRTQSQRRCGGGNEVGRFKVVIYIEVILKMPNTTNYSSEVVVLGL